MNLRAPRRPSLHGCEVRVNVWGPAGIDDSSSGLSLIGVTTNAAALTEAKGRGHGLKRHTPLLASAPPRACQHGAHVGSPSSAPSSWQHHRRSPP